MGIHEEDIYVLLLGVLVFIQDIVFVVYYCALLNAQEQKNNSYQC